MNDHLVVVKQSAELGRYAVAKKPIKAGNLLISEPAFVFGPKPGSPPLCLGCYCPVDGSGDGPRCAHCKWPLCSDNCDGAEIHYDAECQVFQDGKVKFFNVQNSKEPCLQLDCITPLRLLLKKETNPNDWENLIEPMEYHDLERRSTEIFKVDEINVTGYLLGPCRLKDRFSPNLIQQACGILEVNSFEAKTPDGHDFRAIYPKTAIMAHSCVPNISHTIHPSKNFSIEVRASVDIPADELLYTSYTYTLWGTAERQEHLKQSKFFTCRCKRCLDPTELGTNFSTLKCNKCDNGWFLSTDTLAVDSDWKCSSCGGTTSQSAISKVISLIKAEFEVATIGICEPQQRLDAYEKLIRKYQNVFHPNHYLIIAIKQQLIEMYGRTDGYLLSDLPDLLLARKIEMCREVLKVLDVIQPGITRIRATLLYEMHAPIVLMAKQDFANGELVDEPLRKRISEVIEMLSECKRILHWEDPTTPDGILGHIASEALNQLKQSLDTI